jgi:predicted alpha/beta superfamily hydrolase
LKKRISLCTVTFLIALNVLAQHQVTFRVTKVPSYQQAASTLYVAGSFNNWNPKHADYQFSKNDDHHFILTVSLPAGKHEFKLTRGGWNTGETAREGGSLPNRTIDVTKDMQVELVVEDWADHYETSPVRSTANEQVKIMDSAFYIPQLDRTRRVWIYLPSGYETSGKKYPVLYMHDGQNIFDDITSYSGEWGIDEALDSLGSGCRELIVVAIENGGDKRMNEYSPYDMERFGKGEGDAYATFLVETLKPYINKHYPVSRQRKDQFIAGSSMGGLISLYTVLKYPRSFGAAGIFSPAFWVAPEIEKAVKDRGKKVKTRLYFHAGMLEGDQMVPDMLRIFETMNKESGAEMTSVIRAEGRHHESAWRKEFSFFYCWMID